MCFWYDGTGVYRMTDYYYGLLTYFKFNSVLKM